MKKVFLKNWTLKDEKGKYALPVSVPCDVTAELYKSNCIVDPMYGTNAEKLSWIAEETWILESTFSLEKDVLSLSRVFLNFDGMDTLATVFLNGVELGKANNMFRRYRYEVKSLLKEKDNFLQVVFPSTTAYIREKNDGTNYRALFTLDRVYIRKAQCHWGWDWAPNLPGIGLWLPVYLEGDEGIQLDNVKVQTYLDGRVRITSTIENGDYRIENEDGEYTLLVETDGQTQEITPKRLINGVNFRIENPKLWWPNGYGEQPLYEYRVCLCKKGRVLDELCGSYGIRTVELVQEPIEENKTSFALKFNGRVIFCKGSNWVPISNLTGAIEDSAYERLILAAKEGNMNMLRVWGGGIYEKEIFYRLCDEYGILVLQDFMTSCSAIPTEIEELGENIFFECKEQIVRLRNHPSIAIWCGGNEYRPHAQGSYYKKGNHFIRITLQGLCQEMDGSRPYIHNSPYGLGEDEWDIDTGDAHISCMDTVLSANDVENYRKYIAELPAQFISESAHLGPSRIRSLKKFIPEEELSSYGRSWNFHFVENPYAPVPETFLEKEQKLATALYGKYTSVEDFVKKSMLTHGEMLGAEADFSRANPSCKGFMNWMYNDNWGCGTWALVDYYFEKKPAYHAMKRSFATCRVCFTQENEGVFVHVCNEEENKTGVLTVFAKNLDGKALSKQEISLTAEKDIPKKIAVTLNEGDYLSAEFVCNAESYKEIFLRKPTKEYTFQGDISYTAEETDDGCQVKITAKSFARGVFVDCADNSDVYYSDNFFDMEAGEEKTVVITGKSAKNQIFTVKTYVDDWTE